MVEVISALAGHLTAGPHGVARKGQGVSFREMTGRDLVQAGWWPATVAAVKATLAKELGFAVGEGTRKASESGAVCVFPIAPDKLWIAAPVTAGLFAKLSAAITPDQGVVTELGHARTIVRLSGPSSRDVLARNFALDFDPAVFPPGSFASSSMHHISTMLHYVRDEDRAPVFDIYLPRTFALSLFEGLCHNAESFGYTIAA